MHDLAAAHQDRIEVGDLGAIVAFAAKLPEHAAARGEERDFHVVEPRPQLLMNDEWEKYVAEIGDVRVMQDRDAHKGFETTVRRNSCRL